jgi:hypothetical protein
MAVEAASELSAAPRVGVSGISQGGGLALASVALVPRVVAVCQGSRDGAADGRLGGAGAARIKKSDKRYHASFRDKCFSG